MALSACFGGPMLNILLGIGIGGLWMTIHEGQGQHDHHPNRPFKYSPYQVEISSTLIVSAITVLITLLSLIIIVPLNKWAMDKRIGGGLVALWCVSTIINVVIEVRGFGVK